MNLNNEIEKVVEEFDKEFGTLYEWSEHPDRKSIENYLCHSLRSIAEKTVEAVRVEEMKGAIPRSFSEHDKGFNQAVTEQTKKAQEWLGGDV